MTEYTERQLRNIEIAHRAFDAYAAGDIDGVLAALSPDVIVHSPAGMGNAGTFHGREGYREWSGPWEEMWQEFHSEIEELEPLGERHLIAVVNQRGRGRDGIEVTAQNAFAYELGEDGLCSRMGLYPTYEDARAMVREWGAPD